MAEVHRGVRWGKKDHVEYKPKATGPPEEVMPEATPASRDDKPSKQKSDKDSRSRYNVAQTECISERRIFIDTKATDKTTEERKETTERVIITATKNFMRTIDLLNLERKGKSQAMIGTI